MPEHKIDQIGAYMVTHGRIQAIELILIAFMAKEIVGNNWSKDQLLRFKGEIERATEDPSGSVKSDYTETALREMGIGSSEGYVQELERGFVQEMGNFKMLISELIQRIGDEE